MLWKARTFAHLQAIAHEGKVVVVATDSAGAWQVVLQVKLMHEVWTARNSVRRGARVSSDDLVRERRDVINAREPLADFASLTNDWEAANFLAAGATVLARSLRPQVAMRRGQMVEAIVSNRISAPPMALQGPWTRDGGLPPWKGDYHNDLNTQMTYVAYPATGMFDSGLALLDFDAALLPRLLHLHQHAALEDVFHHEDRLLGHAHVDLVDVRAEHRLAEAVEEIGDAQRGHQQRDALLIDQATQH